LKHRLQLFALVALLLKCSLAASAPPGQAATNVILITIDTVRADHLGCYGATNVQTPVLDGLARDGVVFERAISQVPLTWPSHAAILTGTYPFQNGVQDFTGQPLDERFRTVGQLFKLQGYSTGAVVSSFVLDRSWGLARGFDFYDDAFSAESFQQKEIGLVDRSAEDSVTRALRWLNRWQDLDRWRDKDGRQKTPKRPFFFWLHLYDPHSPYDPPEPFRTRYRGHLYDGEIAYADNELGRLIAWLKQNRLYDRSLIVFLSDHGESLGDHGEKEHGFFVYDSTVRIPLIVKPPAGSGVRPGRVARPVETVAIAPTMVRFIDRKSPGAKSADLRNIEKQFQSPGLLDSDAGNNDAAYSESFYSFSSFGWSPLHALETSRYHYIEAPVPELYDVLADPQERNNLASQQIATVAVLKDKLQTLLHRSPFKPQENAASGLSPDALEKLRALGYVAYRSPVSAEALAAGLSDPKNKLWEFNAILETGDAFRAGDFAAGEAVLDRVEEKDPQMYVVPFMRGEAAARQQKWKEAANAFQKCLQLNPGFDQAMTGLAHALFSQGDVEGAASWLEKALKYNPQNYRAWYELGSLRLRNVQDKTDKPAAASAYAKAVSIQPNFAQGWRELGILQAQQQNYQDAAKALSKATELGLGDAKLFNFLGIAYSRTNRQPQAIEAFRKALQVDPQLAEAHLNLAYAYEQTHKPLPANQEYQEACRLRADFCRFVKEQKQ
jgi:arylsulfatase A-like enzyme/Tfp pilus assembly protein PilF